MTQGSERARLLDAMIDDIRVLFHWLKATAEAMRRRERDLLGTLDLSVSTEELVSAQRVLSALRDSLAPVQRETRVAAARLPTNDGS